MKISKYFAMYAALMTLGLSGCIAPKMYLDKNFTDVASPDPALVVDPQPVQFLFQFQTKGAQNNRATKLTRSFAMTALVESRYFSEVSEAPVANGAILSLTINNIPQENAASSGFVTGLTFGAKKTVVSDYYVATIEYVDSADGEISTAIANHRVITKIGAGADPEDGIPMPDADTTVETFVTQITTSALNELAATGSIGGEKQGEMEKIAMLSSSVAY